MTYTITNIVGNDVTVDYEFADGSQDLGRTLNVVSFGGNTDSEEGVKLGVENYGFAHEEALVAKKAVEDAKPDLSALIGREIAADKAEVKAQPIV